MDPPILFWENFVVETGDLSERDASVEEVYGSPAVWVDGEVMFVGFSSEFEG